MILTQALRYPFQGRGWARRLLLMTLLQLLPIVGQLILLGYGFEIVRAVYAGEVDLPPIRWQFALGNGIRILLAGTIYCLPIAITGGLLGMSALGIHTNANIMGTLSIILSIGIPLAALVGGLLYSSRKRAQIGAAQKQAQGPGPVLAKILPVIVMILAIFALKAVVSNADFGRPNTAAVVLIVVLALLVFVIGLGLGLGGVRQAITQRGLFSPTSSVTLLQQHRSATGMLMLNLLLLGIITLLITSLGLVLLILPGLFAFVVCSIAMWYLFAHFGMQIGIRQINAMTTSDNISFLKTPTTV